MNETDRVHKPGDCTDPHYGNPWCDGIARLAPNPYSWEIYDDDTPVWMCDGERAGAAADI